MTGKDIHPSGFSQRIQLIDKNNARGVLHRLSKKIPHPRRSYADKHLDKVGTGDAEEGNPGFSGHRPGQKGLAGTRRPQQKHSFGDASAKSLIFLRGLEKFDDLDQLFLCLIDSLNIGKRNAGLFLDIDLRLAFADLHEAGAAPSHPLHEIAPYKEKQRYRNDPG